MSRQSTLLRGQRKADASMVDTCLIRRPVAGEPDPVTGDIPVTYEPDPVYDGKCRIQQQTGAAQPQDAGEAHLLMVALQLQIPMAVTGVEPDDHVTIGASRDPDLTGRTFVVRDLFHKTDATARRIGVVERTS